MKIIITIIIAITAMTGLVIGVNHLSYLQCKNNVEEMNREFRYDIINGCRIGQKDGTFIFWQMYREVNN